MSTTTKTATRATSTPVATALFAITLVAMTLVSLPAFAAGEEGGGGLFSGDIGNAIWTLAVFIALALVLGKYAWKPILNALQAREDFIRDALAKAKTERDEVTARLAEYEGILAEARAEATAIVEEGRRDAEVLRQRIEASAREESEKVLERAKREIGIAKETVVKELYELSGRLATDIAAKIVGRELNPGDHRRLIAESIEEIDQRRIN